MRRSRVRNPPGADFFAFFFYLLTYQILSNFSNTPLDVSNANTLKVSRLLRQETGTGDERHHSLPVPRTSAAFFLSLGKGSGDTELCEMTQLVAKVFTSYSYSKNHNKFENMSTTFSHHSNQIQIAYDQIDLSPLQSLNNNLWSAQI